LKVLLLDEGSAATTDNAEGCRWGRSTYPGAVASRSSAGTQKFRGAGRSESPAKEHLPTADASRHGPDCPVIVRSSRRTTQLLQRKSPANAAFLRAAEGIRTLDLLHGKQYYGPGYHEAPPANARIRARGRRQRQTANSRRLPRVWAPNRHPVVSPREHLPFHLIGVARGYPQMQERGVSRSRAARRLVLVRYERLRPACFDGGASARSRLYVR